MNLTTDYDPASFKPCSHFWSALDSGAYCGCGECRCPIGYGATEAEAIADLQAQLAELGA